MAVRLPWERSEGKVQAWHRDRLAAVYVRQSTAAQVVYHQESTRLQYGLVERAVALGWTAERVLVIDEDLGHSASGADARPGFQRLVSEVGLDHVGIVLGIEMSRLTAAEREQIRLLAADIPAVWHAPTTTAADRKKLIRHLIEQVRIAVAGVSEKADVDIAWVGGHHTQGQVVRPVATLAQLSYYPQLRERARKLIEAGMTTAQIAGQLNAEGFRPPKRTEIFTPNAVSDLLRALGITRNRIPALRSRPPLAEHEWWLRDLAEHVGMPEITLDAWVRRGWATGYLHPQSGNRVVRADPAEIERLRALHQVPRGQHNRRRWMKDQAAGINIESDTEESDNERAPQE